MFFKPFALGVGSAFVGGALGIGGGILVIPILSKQPNFTQLQAQATASPSNTVTSLASTAFFFTRHWLNSQNQTTNVDPNNTNANDSRIHFDIAATASIAALIASPIGVRLSTRVPDLTLRRMFAVGLAAMGPITVMKQYFVELNLNQSAIPSNVATPAAAAAAGERPISLPAAAFAGCAVGFLSGLSGFGAGILMTTFLCMSTDLKHQQIVGLSLASLALPNIAQSLIHLRNGSINKPVALALMCGASIGAPIGSYAALQVEDKQLKYIFSAYLMLTGFRSIWSLRKVPIVKATATKG